MSHNQEGMEEGRQTASSTQCADPQEGRSTGAGVSGAERSIPTTCIETIGGDPGSAIRLSFQIKVF